MKKSLFTFGGTLPDNMSGMKIHFSIKDVTTVHKTGNNNNALSTDTGFFSIIRQMIGVDPRRQINAAASGTKVLVEMIDKATGEKQLCLYDISTNSSKMKATEQNTNGIFTDYSDGHAGSIMKAAFLCGIQARGDNELNQVLTEIIPLCEYDSDNSVWLDALTLEKFAKLLCKLSNNLYYQATKLNNSTEVTVEKMRQSDYDLFIKTSGLQVLYGNPTFAIKKEESTIIIKQGEYSFCPNRKFSADEKGRIPVLDKSYVTPAWVQTVCADIRDSSVFSQPMRNVLLTGSSGGGKTKGVQAIANYLGLPCVKVTCSPDTDMFDLIGQMLPNTEKVDIEEIYDKFDIPTFDDVEFDYENSYKRLFGKEPTNMDSPSDCYAEITKRVLHAVHSSSDFTYVESDFVKAVKNGWVVEIQEPTVIKREAVLVGLNAILENDSETASLTLPTGKTIHRHPDCVVIMTTNADYKGCKSIQQSVLSRMDIVREIPVPEIDILVSRCKAQTGFPEKKLLKKMATTVVDINKYCKDHDITDGVCGPRELNNWAKHSIMMSKRVCETVITESTVIQAAFTVLLTKCSQVAEEMEEIITSSFQKNFEQTEVENARVMYEAGSI